MLRQEPLLDVQQALQHPVIAQEVRVGTCSHDGVHFEAEQLHGAGAFTRGGGKVGFFFFLSLLLDDRRKDGKTAVQAGRVFQRDTNKIKCKKIKNKIKNNVRLQGLRQE